MTGLPEEAIQAVQSVVSLLRGQPVDKRAAAEKSTDELLGLFRDEPELLDQIVQEAMSARETQPLRLEPVQKLFRLFRVGANRVVPLRANRVAGQLDSFELGLGDLQARWVGSVEVGRGDFQAGRGRGAANEG